VLAGERGAKCGGAKGGGRGPPAGKGGMPTPMGGKPPTEGAIGSPARYLKYAWYVKILRYSYNCCYFLILFNDMITNLSNSWLVSKMSTRNGEPGT